MTSPKKLSPLSEPGFTGLKDDQDDPGLLRFYA
jgi:hypothetical protein